jgi:hypothetical protein
VGCHQGHKGVGYVGKSGLEIISCSCLFYRTHLIEGFLHFRTEITRPYTNSYLDIVAAAHGSIGVHKCHHSLFHIEGGRREDEEGGERIEKRGDDGNILYSEGNMQGEDNL